MDNDSGLKFENNVEATPKDKWDSDKYEQMDTNKELESYTPPSVLKFNPEIVSRFAQAGFKLKWVNSNPKSVRERLHPSEGYTFVSPSEFSDSEIAALGEIEAFRDKEVISNGDLVLMKVRIEKNEARKRYFQNKTKSQQEAINERIRNNKLQTEGSRSVVRTGKNAHFSS